MDHCFPRKERLRSNKEIERLLTEGRSKYYQPFRLIWMVFEGINEPSVKTAILVPKKKISRASARNLTKRRIREVYRKNRFILRELAENYDRSFHFLIMYTGKEVPSYKETEISLVRAMVLWKDEYEKSI